MPPDYASLEARLRDRGSEDPKQLRRRLSQARREVEGYTRYDYLVVNDDLDRAAEELTAIVEAQRCRVSTRRAHAERILATFPVEGESQ
jgi:guanylate kinase